LVASTEEMLSKASERRDSMAGLEVLSGVEPGCESVAL
jgi:hypothetical protein